MPGCHAEDTGAQRGSQSAAAQKKGRVHAPGHIGFVPDIVRKPSRGERFRAAEPPGGEGGAALDTVPDMPLFTSAINAYDYMTGMLIMHAARNCLLRRQLRNVQKTLWGSVDFTDFDA